MWENHGRFQVKSKTFHGNFRIQVNSKTRKLTDEHTFGCELRFVEEALSFYSLKLSTKWGNNSSSSWFEFMSFTWCDEIRDSLNFDRTNSNFLLLWKTEQKKLKINLPRQVLCMVYLVLGLKTWWFLLIFIVFVLVFGLVERSWVGMWKCWTGDREKASYYYGKYT